MVKRRKIRMSLDDKKKSKYNIIADETNHFLRFTLYEVDNPTFFSTQSVTKLISIIYLLDQRFIPIFCKKSF